MHEIDTTSAERALVLFNPRRAYHRARLVGVERLPLSGGAVIVSNHGRLDFDTFLLLRLILRSCGRPPRLMADHMWFTRHWLERLFTRVGAVDGTPENARELLEHGEMILTYPGGVREIFGSKFGREEICWQGRRGFARVAIEAGVPVVPIVGVGVNSGLVFLTSGRFLGRLLFQDMLRLGPAYADYRNPLAIGIIPIPLPLGIAVSLPLPCRLTYFVGEPISPPAAGPDRTLDAVAEEFADQVAAAMQRLIYEHGRPATLDPHRIGGGAR